jgi:hypothetical protein
MADTSSNIMMKIIVLYIKFQPNSNFMRKRHFMEGPAQCLFVVILEESLSSQLISIQVIQDKCEITASPQVLII